MPRRLSVVFVLFLALHHIAVAQTNTFPTSGNVGIGTTSPQSALDVVGNINSSTTTAGLGMNSYGNSSPYIYVGSLPNAGTGVIQHLEVEVLGGSWVSQGLTRWACNAYGGAVRCTRMNDSYSPNMNDIVVFLNSNNNYDFYVSGNANNGWSSFAVSARVFDGTYYRIITPVSTSPSGTQQSIALTVGPTLTQVGNVGIGTTVPNAKLEVNGSLLLTAGSGASMTYADGTTQSTAWTGVLSGGDYAESVDVTGNREQYEPGDVLVVDSNHPGHFIKASERYSMAVAGVYSTKPGVVGRRQHIAKSLVTTEVPMAMVGIVPTKVTNENGLIKPGDVLVTSSRPGYAMKGTDRSLLAGAVIGKALEPLKGESGVIEAVISVQ